MRYRRFWRSAMEVREREWTLRDACSVGCWLPPCTPRALQPLPLSVQLHYHATEVGEDGRVALIGLDARVVTPSDVDRNVDTKLMSAMGGRGCVLEGRTEGH